VCVHVYVCGMCYVCACVCMCMLVCVCVCVFVGILQRHQRGLYVFLGGGIGARGMTNGA